MFVWHFSASQASKTPQTFAGWSMLVVNSYIINDVQREEDKVG